MSCPVCQELQRQGIDDPIMAIKRMMLIHQFYVTRITAKAGIEMGMELASQAEAFAAEHLKKEMQ